MEQVVSLVGLATLVMKFTDFLKFLTNKDWNATVTQIIAWVGGCVAVFLASATMFAKAKGFDIGGIQLDKMDFWTQVYAGLSAASVGGVIYDYKKARDDKDSAATPPLVPNSQKAA